MRIMRCVVPRGYYSLIFIFPITIVVLVIDTVGTSPQTLPQTSADPIDIRCLIPSISPTFLQVLTEAPPEWVPANFLPNCGITPQKL